MSQRNSGDMMYPPQGATGVTDGVKGDVEVTSSGAVWTLAEVPVTPGVYTNPTIEIDSKGRVIDAASGTGIGLYEPGSFTVPTASYSLLVRHLIVTSTNRVTLEGTATLRIS